MIQLWLELGLLNPTLKPDPTRPEPAGGSDRASYISPAQVWAYPSGCQALVLAPSCMYKLCLHTRLTSLYMRYLNNH